MSTRDMTCRSNNSPRWRELARSNNHQSRNLKAEGGIRTLNPRFTKAVLCH
jgi:hypothetical protein